MPKLEITNEDNMDLMARYPDKYFDLAIVDPPYGINWTDTIDYTEKQKIHQNKAGYKTHIVKKWDKFPPNEKYFKELFRVSKNQIIWGGNYFADKLPISRCWICWNKMGENFTAINNELAWTSFDKRIKVFSRVHGMDKGFMNKDGGGIHPTEKPVALYRWLLKNYTEEGNKILDTHLGSGSIAIACHYMGFDLTACELDEDYYKATMQRIKDQTRQLTLSL
jgi:site-specific DNA-methyltransferase (adenine-specific)